MGADSRQAHPFLSEDAGPMRPFEGWEERAEIFQKAKQRRDREAQASGIASSKSDA